MRIEFTKMHGLGNDFAVFDAPGAAALDGELIRRLADRHTGIGFDQALVLEAPERTDAAVFYRIFNADGVEVEQCGNGARCIAALLAARGLARSGAVTMDSPAGLIQARIARGRPGIGRHGTVPLRPALTALRCAARRRSAIPSSWRAIASRSARSRSATRMPSSRWSRSRRPPWSGSARRSSAIRAFPKRVNAGFMQIVDRAHIRLRVYERGAGETLACGTGACAAVAVGRHWGQLDCEVHVSVRGGELRVHWNGPGENIWLTGPAEVSFAGHVEV